MKFKSCLSIILFVFGFAAHAGVCDIPADQETRMLALPYNDFDQSMGRGWRKYADLGCYNETATLLDQYLAKNKPELVDWQIRVITWHSGQMYAFNNTYPVAKVRFLDSLNPNEPKDTQILWNDYVYASVAFLDKDMTTLKLHRDAIASGPDFNGEKANLRIVDSFIKCFDKPYAIAYSGCQK